MHQTKQSCCAYNEYFVLTKTCDFLIASFDVHLESAAATEPAWQGAGQEEGLQIWRIEVNTKNLYLHVNLSNICTLHYAAEFTGTYISIDRNLR